MENEKLVELLEDKEQFGRKIAEGLGLIATEIYGEEIEPNSVSGKKMLEEINSPQDLKKLTLQQKKKLAEEIRNYIIEIVSKNGGHLASNLGVVELTIALHTVFNVPEDKIIWDVGHQCYVHKILTGRREEFKNLRKPNGLAGFPKSNESPADSFNTGHSSTSISAALGMARARDLQGKNNAVIAVIGDGALTGGMALEALNDAGYSKCKMTVILNDNEMSISPNVGGLNKFLGKLRTKKLYTTTNNLLKRQTNGSRNSKNKKSHKTISNT